MAQYTDFHKQLMSSQVEDAMMDYVMHQCEIGQKLPNEFELADKFGTSRSTIREVVKTLVSREMLRVRQGSGTYVVSQVPKGDDPLNLQGHKDKYKLALELFDVRLMLEPEIAAKAANEATPEEIRELTRLCKEVEDLYNAGEDHTQKDLELHAQIARSSHNSVVMSLVPLIQMAVYTFVNVTQGKLKEETITTHRAIVRAIQNHDITGARVAMTSHMAANREMIVTMMEERDRKNAKKMEETSDMRK